jgi:mono/diheme cytochrome c family protein
MKAFILGFIVGLLVVFLVINYYFRSGSAPVATSAPGIPFEESLAHAALHARATKEAPKNVPIAADDNNLVAGAGIYKQNCAVCHGLPNQPPGALAKGMFPKPPQLFSEHEMVTDDPPGVTFWKAANGIRLTGMPAFSGSLSNMQLWQVSVLLAHADKLPASVTDKLKP